MAPSRHRNVIPSEQFIAGFKQLFEPLDIPANHARYLSVYGAIDRAVGRTPGDIHDAVLDEPDETPIYTFNYDNILWLDKPITVMYRLVDEANAELLFVEERPRRT